MRTSLTGQSTGLPTRQGLYDPQFERDACGIGFVVDIKGRKSHGILCQALTVLRNLTHRGACGAEPNTGDGAGILMQIPHAFLLKECVQLGIPLPAPSRYGVAMVFLPTDEAARQECQRRFEEIVVQEGQQLLGWRTVPTEGSSLGKTARSTEPAVRQFLVGRDPRIEDDMAFERKLYVIRRRAEREIRYGELSEAGGSRFYVSSISSRTLVYKGMLMAEQLETFYPDLADPAMETALALVHSRFSTNTFPSWDRAHPYRYLIHNGEINTLRGNVNWMRAREALFESSLFGNDLPKVLPVVSPDGSDSAMFDNLLEFLTLAGRSLPHAIMMMIPEPWQNHEDMSDDRRAFYQYHSALMEPWDGPACIGFSDGTVVGAVLDRNGLRPSRYYVTGDGLVVMASEVGVLEIPPERVLQKGRLEPGRMFLVDTRAGRIVSDEELKHQIATARPYRTWLKDHLVTLEEMPGVRVDGYRSVSFNEVLGAKQITPGAYDWAAVHGQGGNLDILSLDSDGTGHEGLVQLQQLFGYSYEDLRAILEPMARSGVEPVGSMGNDLPLAVLSDRPQMLYDYFKQLFAQVTNPPIDAIREEIITSAEVLLGSERNLLEPRRESCQRIKLKRPILTNGELARLRLVDRPGFNSITLPMLFTVAEGGPGLERAMEGLFQAADDAIEEGANLLILSDRGVDGERAPIPALLAVAGLHHHLIRQGTRTRVSLLLESGEPREVHHFATLIGYGAAAVNPYLALRSLDDMIAEELLTDLTYEQAEYRYVSAAAKGVMKTISKMGISTVQSYCGAQIFEAVGLSQRLVDRYFTWTPSRIGGIGIGEVAADVQARHAQAFQGGLRSRTLEPGGHYQWRQEGEHHRFNPQTVYLLQQACRTDSWELYRQYADAMSDQTRMISTLRGLLELEFAPEPLPLEEVESVESICRRFKTGAMSFGSISREAHETLAIAMNRLGGKSNTGEGGEDPERYLPLPNGDSRSSAIKQVASGRFGVTSEYLVSAQEIQIKMAQGAKPGEGGQLPGRKVYPWVAKVRGTTAGVGLISPPPHHDIYSIEDLAELIHDLKNANPRARISVKLVSEVGVGTIAAGVAKGHADVILISGYDGGTGASPRSSIKHAGLPWELGLAETHQTLLLNDLRGRVRLETDGQLDTGRDVAIAALLGAEEFGFATAPLVALGCTKMRVCQLDTCPMGIATQNPELRKRFAGKPEHVVNFMRFIAQEMRELMARMGFRTVDEMIGRTDRLRVRRDLSQRKAGLLDLSPILYRPEASSQTVGFHRATQDHGLDRALDTRVLLGLCAPALERGEPVSAVLPIRNTDRVVGTLLGSEVTRRHGAAGLPEDTVRLHFQGSAGQSFGAFLPSGITLILEGDSNDYVGKGLSGGKIVVYPPRRSTFVPEENVIVGNVAFYGATGGEAYVRGRAGERFCVRNSGLRAVVEGVGDHGCEYMTGGRVVVLGTTGRNFAAGMSGGVAYVLDEAGDFHRRCNQEMVYLERLEEDVEIGQVEEMIRRHGLFASSQLAWRILANWEAMVSRFVKVMPRDYRRMLEAFRLVEAAGLSGEEAIMTAFEQNKNDLTRVSGN